MQQVRMWRSAKTILNFGSSLDLSRKLCGSVLLGSAIFAGGTSDHEDNLKFKWKNVEFPREPKPNDVLLSRKIVSSLDKTGLNLRLYQYQTCPYCCKVRAFLDYHAFSYEVVEVNPVTRAQIKFAKDYKKVPILTCSGLDRPLVESSLIVSVLYTFLIQKSKSIGNVTDLFQGYEKVDDKGKVTMSYPNQHFIMFEDGKLSPLQIGERREEREWREWVDNHFIHLISPNVYRTFSESLETFRYFDQVGDWKRNFPGWERYMAIYVGASAMYLISKRLKKRHNIVDERQSLREAFEKFMEAKGPRPFMGGESPSLADLALYGAINSFAGCAAFKQMRLETRIGEWFDAVQTQVQEGRGRKLIEERCK